MKARTYNRKEILLFSIMMSLLLSVIGAWGIWRDEFVWDYPRIQLVSLGGLLLLGGIASPRTIQPILDLWMTLTGGIGQVVTVILLSLLYLTFLIPIALIRRLFGADPMGRARAAEQQGYWRKPDKEERGSTAFEQQF